MLLNSLQRQK